MRMRNLAQLLWSLAGEVFSKTKGENDSISDPMSELLDGSDLKFFTAVAFKEWI